MNLENTAMSERKLRRIFGVGVFLVALVTYLLTVQPSVSFWDCGEFIATAYTLAVPHPPGAPFFLILGRFVGMILPFVSDLALRINLISVVSSAFTVLFLFLIGVRLIERWRGAAKSWTDVLIVFGSSAIGALVLTFSDTFWFNAVEAEVYAMSMLFLSGVVLLGMIWYEKAEVEGSEKYLVLGAYLMGLSIGVHQLSLLAYFSIAMFVFFKYYEFQWKRFFTFGVVSVLTFFVIWPGIVNWIPDALDGSFKGGPIDIRDSDLLRISPLLVIGGLLYGVYYSAKHKKRILNIATLSLLLMIVGYSTYMQVLIRASAKPPINENNPDEMSRFVAYMNREQYGQAPPITQRRWSTEPLHQASYQKYTSDSDYFWRYQLGHMYFRYLAWNFIGRAGDIQDAPATLLSQQSAWSESRGFPNRYFALPFLLGLIGLYYHFKKDWKFALSFLALFLVTGVVLVIYFNMAEPQPRERDYFFVGSFFVFALWVGIGAAGILDSLGNWVKEDRHRKVALGVGAGFIAFVVPVNMAVQNYFDHSRNGNYIPWDYSYNILQSCEKDAILFTNGDNDTFPLWYLQEVEGIRTDIRVVNLSLVNTDWYILQLKNEEPHGAKKVPMNLTDDQIRNLSLAAWSEKDIDLAVPKEVFARFGVSDTSITNKGKITFRMPPTLQAYDRQGRQVTAIRIQDIMVREIVLATKWERPVYFAVTVAPEAMIGLDNYLQMEGLAMRLTPVRGNGIYDIRQSSEEHLRESLFNEPEGFYREPHRGFKFRGLANPRIYFNENDRRMMGNYRNAFIRLSWYYVNVHDDTTRAVEVMDRMEKTIPRSIFPMDYWLMSSVARVYHWAGRRDTFEQYFREIEEICWSLINRGEGDLSFDRNPYRTLIEMYDLKGDYRREAEVLKAVQRSYPTDPDLKKRIAQLESLYQAGSGAVHRDSIRAQSR